MGKTNLDEEMISRPDLARRWNCHTETLKRREKKGLLHPLFLSTRMIRYRLEEVLALEAAANGPQADTAIPGRFSLAHNEREARLKGSEETDAA